MYTEYHITMDSFGQECPENWQEIADYLNNIIDERVTPDEYGNITEDDKNTLCKIWEDYWNENMQDAPKPIA